MVKVQEVVSDFSTPELVVVDFRQTLKSQLHICDVIDVHNFEQVSCHFINWVVFALEQSGLLHLLLANLGFEANVRQPVCLL